MVYFILVTLFLAFCCGSFYQSMNPDRQIYTQNVIIQQGESNSRTQNSFSFGLLSRYSPLSNIAQVGKIGILNSDCFHYLNAADKQKKINFIYYDCIDYVNQLITKHVRFIDDNNEEHHFTVIISNNQYEKVWYYFEINQWPDIKQLKILIQQNNEIIFSQELIIKYPFFSSELILTFGGGADAYFETSLMQLSYFPGTLYLRQFSYQNQPPYEGIRKINIPQYSCQCQENENTLIINSNHFTMNEKIVFTSAHSNCDYFQLAGWMKITEVISEDDDVKFHLIQITKSTQNIQLRNENLSPFNFFYYISEECNKIIYTTYSYQFPSVNIDFSTDPYLIQQEFEISQSLYQWHYISVSLIDTQFIISIEFPDGSNSLKYEQITEVNQFQIVTFEIQIGNIQDSKLNYLNYMVNSFKFSNCDTVKFTQACHYSCSICDGPTENDCLECQLNSNRIYLSELKKCVCPYDSIDVEICQTYTDYNFILFQDNDQIPQCKYGQFEYDNECLTWQYYKYYISPQTVSDQQINCIECLNNPKTWKDMLYCETSIISQNDQSYQDLIDIYYFYIIDGQDVKFCQTCQQICQEDNCFLEEFQQGIISYGKMCSSSTNTIGYGVITKIGVCYDCTLLGCIVCGMSQKGLYCLICKRFYKLKNGLCESSFSVAVCFNNCSYCEASICYSCYPPYYLNSDKSQCKVCPIKYCKHCFEYQENDLTKATLYQRFQPFSIDQFTQIGCSLCENGFNFDFLSRQCIESKPQITNCLRSYINLQRQEICILSEIDDFNVAPQIINCQQHIKNCIQCLLTPSQVIKCVLCENGYTATISGNCEVSC